MDKKVFRFTLGIFCSVALVCAGAAPARASAFNNFRACVAPFLKRILVDSMVANYQGRTLEFHALGGSEAFTLTLGKSLGNGLSAQVYTLEGVQGLAIPEARGQKLVVKMPHSLKWKTEPESLAMKDGALIREYDNNRILLNQVDELWKDPVMQSKKNVWIEGRVPVAPIYRMIKTDSGVMLFKPLVKGKTLGQIFWEAGGDLSKIPVEMRQNARDIFDLAQAARRTVRVKKNSKNTWRMFTADLKPDNFLWVDDPALFETYGLRKPGFVFVELTHFPKTPRYTYDAANMTAEEYEKMFVSYVEEAGRR